MALRTKLSTFIHALQTHATRMGRDTKGQVIGAGIVMNGGTSNGAEVSVCMCICMCVYVYVCVYVCVCVCVYVKGC
jgi:hypothetical protein